MTKKKGYLISFEGAEAVGKSTQIELLAKSLRRAGHKVYCTREPGGSPLGEKIRKLVKSEEMSSMAELLLMEASRAELVETEIRPRLEAGEIILCDRFQESSLVYQGIMGGIDVKTVRMANQLATAGLKSDMIIWLDIDEASLAERLKGRKGNKDRFDSRPMAYHKALVAAYRRLSRQQKRPKMQRFSATKEAEALHQQILKSIDRCLKIR